MNDVPITQRTHNFNLVKELKKRKIKVFAAIIIIG